MDRITNQVITVVHKTIVLFFKSMSKYKISAHSLPRWRKLKELQIYIELTGTDTVAADLM